MSSVFCRYAQGDSSSQLPCFVDLRGLHAELALHEGHASQQNMMDHPVAVCYFPHRLQRTLSAGVVMDKGLEHDVDEVEDESNHDVDHVQSIGEPGLKPENELMLMHSSFFKFQHFEILTSSSSGRKLPLPIRRQWKFRW